jgi:hypothetical protein
MKIVSFYSSSFPSSSSNFSYISSFDFSSDFIPFASLKSSYLYHSAGALVMVDIDSNNEDAIDILLEIGDKNPYT